MDGTSAASAIVSGVAALVRAKHPEMPAKDVVNTLIKSAKDLAEPGRDETTGFGMVNPMGALTAQFPPVDAIRCSRPRNRRPRSRRSPCNVPCSRSPRSPTACRS